MMVNNIRNRIFSVTAIALMVGFLAVAIVPQSAFAEGSATTNTADVAKTGDVATTSTDKCNSGFLGFPAWYNNLTKDGSCDLKSPSDFNDSKGNGGLSKFIWTIILNIVQIALMLVGYLSVGYIIYGGFLLMTGRGKPDEIADGQITIRNAVIGLIVSFASVAAVNFIASNIIAVQAVVK